MSHQNPRPQGDVAVADAHQVVLYEHEDHDNVVVLLRPCPELTPKYLERAEIQFATANMPPYAVLVMRRWLKKRGWLR